MNSSGSINLSDEHHSHQPSATSPMSLSTSSSKRSSLLLFFFGVFFFWNLFEVYDLILIHFRFSRHRREADVTEVESSGGGGGGLLSRTILRLRGGEGHHAIAECCWYVSLFEVFERCFDPLQALTSGLDLSWFDYIWIVQRFPSYTSVAFAFAVVSFFCFFEFGEKSSQEQTEP